MSPPHPTPAAFHPVTSPHGPASAVVETIAQLTFPSRLLVWAARTWWADHGEQDGSRQRLAQGFRLARCPDAPDAFDELMLMVAHGACRCVDIRDGLGAPGADEIALLRVVAAFQDDAVIGGERALETWLPPATARLASDPAIKLARAMGRAGLYVRAAEKAL